MKCIRQTPNEVQFELREREAELLGFVLGSFPMAIEGWPQDPKAPKIPASQPDPALLLEALRERKVSNQQEVRLFVEESLRLNATTGTAHWTVSTQRMDWLLQVLNEVRVASWYRLGCPEEDLDELFARMNPEQMQDFIRFFFSGEVISRLLDALETPEP